MKRLVLFLSLFLLISGPSVYAQAPDNAIVSKILTTRGLFGKDFGIALASLPAWRSAGEASIAVLPDRIVGETPFPTEDAAQPERVAVGAALSQPTPAAVRSFATILKGLVGKPSPLKIDVIQFVDDGSFRVTLSGAGLAFLRQELTVKQLETAIGRPESVTTKLIQTQGERRPVVLTLHSYAGGAIVFAESDLSPNPGTVNRVILNVSAISSAVFGSAQ